MAIPGLAGAAAAAAAAMPARGLATASAMQQEGPLRVTLKVQHPELGSAHVAAPAVVKPCGDAAQLGAEHAALSAALEGGVLDAAFFW